MFIKQKQTVLKKVLQKLQDSKNIKKQAGDPETSTEETGFSWSSHHQYINHKHTVTPMNYYILQIIMFFSVF